MQFRVVHVAANMREIKYSELKKVFNMVTDKYDNICIKCKIWHTVTFYIKCHLPKLLLILLIQEGSNFYHVGYLVVTATFTTII